MNRGSVLFLFVGHRSIALLGSIYLQEVKSLLEFTDELSKILGIDNYGLTDEVTSILGNLAFHHVEISIASGIFLHIEEVSSVICNEFS